MSTGVDAIPCFLLTLTVGLIVMFVVILVLRKRGGHVGEPACGNCGYAVRGLPTFTCPECGEDLREVGIVTPGHAGMSPTMRGAILVLLWTLVLPVPALILSTMVVHMTPQRGETRINHSLGNPSSKAYRGIEVQQRVVGSDTSVTSNSVTLTLLPAPGAPIRIEIDPVNLGYRYRTKSGEEVKADAGLDPGKLLDWMSQAGIDRQNEQVKLEAAELLSIATQAASLNAVSGPPIQNAYSLPVRQFSLQGQSAWSNVGPVKWVLVTLVVFWLAVWLLGCWKLWRIGVQKRR